MAAVTFTVLDRPANVPLRFAKRHDRLSVESHDDRCGVLWWQDRVPGGSSRWEIKLRSDEKRRVVACDMDMLAGMDEQWCWHCVRDQRMCGLRTDISC